MPRLFFTYLFIFLIGYLAVFYWRRRQIGLPKEGSAKHKFRPKLEKGLWVQVYDTDTLDDAKKVIARLEEEEIDCVLYEQGRKDVHGNALKDYGIVTPRTSTLRAQNLISRLPV